MRKHSIYLLFASALGIAALTFTWLGAGFASTNSAKIIFEVVSDLDKQASVVAAVKKARGAHGREKEKDGLLEFPGGRCEPYEREEATILRELKEEDGSGVLFEAANQGLNAKTRPISYRTLVLKKNEKLTLFQTTLTQAEWQKLKEFWARNDQRTNPEVYRYELVPRSHLNSQNPNTLKKWTPKSRKILAALRRADLREPL